MTNPSEFNGWMQNTLHPISWIPLYPFFALPIKCFYDDNFIGAEIAPFLMFRSQELCLPFVHYPWLFCLLIVMLSIISFFLYRLFSHSHASPVHWRGMAGLVVEQQFKTNTPQPHPWGRSDGLQGPSLPGPLSPISWYKRSICVGAAPWVPPAIHQWSCFFVQCVCFFLADLSFGTVVLEIDGKFYVLDF